MSPPRFLNNADADSQGRIGAAFGLPPPIHHMVDRLFPFSIFAMYTEPERRRDPRGLAASSTILIVITVLQLASAALQHFLHAKAARYSWRPRLLLQDEGETS